MEVNTTVEIRGEGMSIRLSHEEARDLYEKLKLLFDNRTVYIPYHPVETQPAWREPIWENWNTINCKTDNTIYTLH